MSWWKRTVGRLTASAAGRNLGQGGQRPIDATAIETVAPRDRVVVAGRVREVRVDEAGPRFEVALDDGTGSLWLIFLGRRAVDGVVPGSLLKASGRTCEVEGELAIYNPRYELRND